MLPCVVSRLTDTIGNWTVAIHPFDRPCCLVAELTTNLSRTEEVDRVLPTSLITLSLGYGC